MARKLLFLLGGSPAFEATAAEFVPAAGGSRATIALLLQGGPGWQRYVADYAGPWTRRGVERYDVIVPGDDGRLDVDGAVATLAQATGVFIGGGHTPTYHRLYATGPVRQALRERYEGGVPVAGCSAGALIALEHCLLPAEEMGDAALHIVRGLGLAGGLLVGVHFTERNALPELLEAMAATETRLAWGIDEGSSAVLEDGRFARALGGPVYEIVMADFQGRAYRMREIACRRSER